MKLQIIACPVLLPEIKCCAVAHELDVVTVPLYRHCSAPIMRGWLQEAIDAAETATPRYDAVLLGCGLCGNATAGLCARGTPLVIPRAHDCCTLLLGSQARYKELFANEPGHFYSSAGHVRLPDHQAHFPFATGEDMSILANDFGLDNAAYLSDYQRERRAQLPNCVYYIDIPELPDEEAFALCQKDAERRGRSVRRLPGSLAFIRKLLAGEWDDDTFLVVLPGQRTEGVYDGAEIIRAYAVST